MRVEGQLVFNGTNQMLKAALDGVGLAYVPEELRAAAYRRRSPRARARGVVPVLSGVSPLLPEPASILGGLRPARRRAAPPRLIAPDLALFAPTSGSSQAACRTKPAPPWVCGTRTHPVDAPVRTSFDPTECTPAPRGSRGGSPVIPRRLDATRPHDEAADGTGEERCRQPAERIAFTPDLADVYRRFSKTSFATGSAEKTLGQPT